ncbi:MAG TPA: CotH kinase family protein, partial [Candidatus Binatia bacterium]|nr:CotH kinase family protein [Candidatus Binatia bacterium]
RYTLSGIAPSPLTGIVYTNPIAITNTTVVRALAYKADLLSSDVDCQTYLFLDDVIKQAPTGAAPPGWPTSWGANAVNYGMDPEIVTNAVYKNTIKDDLKAIPTLSIVMSLDDLFNASTGIYGNPGQDGIAWEKPCSLELIYPNDTEGFQVNCGLRIRGGFSRTTSNPKHAFRVFFRQEYGVGKLNYPLFGPTGAESFNKFDIRTMQNYSWAFQGDSRMICIRDTMSRDAQLAMGQEGTRGDFYHLYINGMYWGLYNTEERPEASFGESYFGGREEDYDVIKVEAGPYTINATDGNMDAWARLWQAATNGFANDADYFKIQGLNVDGTPNPAYENLLDVPNLIDYMLVILYGGNLDAPISGFLGNDGPNNWYGLRDRTGQHGGFRFLSHDAEHTLLNVSEDRTGIVDGQIGQINADWTAGNPLTQIGGASAAFARSNPQYIWFRLQQNAEFRLAVADRVQKHCFNGGALTPQSMKGRFLSRSNEIQRAIVGESARWGDAQVAVPYTRATWVAAMADVYNNFLGGRTAVLINQLKADGLFPNLSAPLLNTYGGVVSNGISLFMTNNNGSGSIYYTLDGSDPRVRGGDVGPAATAYTPGTPLVISFAMTLRARVRSGANWSALVEATFYPAQDLSKLLVTEIMYHPPDVGLTPGDEFEFLELKNTGTNILDLSAMSFEGISFTFTNGTR